MRGIDSAFEVSTPRSLSQALSILAANSSTVQPFAGGTDLMVLFEAGKLRQKTVLNLWGLRELKGIRSNKEFLTIGALSTYNDIKHHPIIAKEFPMLAQAARETGGWAIQNRGTLGGNIVNASPAADSPPPLLVYDAKIELSSTRGVRWVPYNDFHKGYKKTALDPDELLTAIRLPRASKSTLESFVKVGARNAQAISKVNFAARARIQKNNVELIRVAVGCAGPMPFRCTQTERQMSLSGIRNNDFKTILKTFSSEVNPIDDIRSTAAYRRQVLLNIFSDFLMKVRERCGIG